MQNLYARDKSFSTRSVTFGMNQFLFVQDEMYVSKSRDQELHASWFCCNTERGGVPAWNWTWIWTSRVRPELWCAPAQFNPSWHNIFIQNIQIIYICVYVKFLWSFSVYLVVRYTSCISVDSLQSLIMRLCAQGHHIPVAWNSRWQWSE